MVARVVEIAHLIKDLTICGLRGYNMCKLAYLLLITYPQLPHKSRKFAQHHAYDPYHPYRVVLWL